MYHFNINTKDCKVVYFLMYYWVSHIENIFLVIVQKLNWNFEIIFHLLFNKNYYSYILMENYSKISHIGDTFEEKLNIKRVKTIIFKEKILLDSEKKILNFEKKIN